MSIIRFVSSLMNPAVLVNRLGRWSPLPLRLIVGYGFMAHGYAKIVKHPENFAAIPSFAQRTRSALHGVGNDCD